MQTKEEEIKTPTDAIKTGEAGMKERGLGPLVSRDLNLNSTTSCRVQRRSRLQAPQGLFMHWTCRTRPFAEHSSPQCGHHHTLNLQLISFLDHRITNKSPRGTPGPPDPTRAHNFGRHSTDFSRALLGPELSHPQYPA